jgi:hypothetical protein
VGQGVGVLVAADTVALDKVYTDTIYAPILHLHNIDSLTDVNTTTPPLPVANDVLTWNGVNEWVPRAVPVTAGFEQVWSATAPATGADNIRWIMP